MNNISGASISSPTMQGRAGEGLAAMGQARDGGARRAQGDQFLTAIASDPIASDLERLIAATARASASGNVYSSTAAHGQTTALRAMAAGVGGPTGVALAVLGAETMQGAYNSDDTRAVSGHWVKALETHGAPTEQVLARAVSASTNLNVYNSSANGARRAAFEMTAAGVPATPDEALARYGLSAMGTAYNSDDTRAMASSVLSSMEKAGTDPLATLLATTATAVSSQKVYNSTAIATQRRAMEFVAAPPTRDVDVLLASLGLDSAAGAYNSDDARVVGGVFLSAIEKNGQNPVAVALAAAALASSHQNVYNSTATGAQKAALGQIQAGTGTDTVEVALSRLGCASKATAYNTRNLRTVGTTLLNQLAARTADPQVKTLVDWALKETSGSLRDSDAANIQQDVFDGIIHGRLAIPPPPPPRAGAAPAPPAIDPAVTLPVIDPKSDPQAQRALLEDSITKNRALIVKLEAQVQATGAELPDIQARIAAGTSRLQQLEGQDVPLKSSYRIAERLGGAAGLVGGVGLIAAFVTASPVAVGLAAVGGMGFAVAHARITKATQEYDKVQREYQSQKFDVLSLTSLASSLQSRMGAIHKVVEQAEKAIVDAHRQLEVFRMADGLTLSPAADATVSVENETLMIGGLRIPRRMAPADADLPTS